QKLLRTSAGVSKQQLDLLPYLNQKRLQTAYSRPVIDRVQLARPTTISVVFGLLDKFLQRQAKLSQFPRCQQTACFIHRNLILDSVPGVKGLDITLNSPDRPLVFFQKTLGITVGLFKLHQCYLLASPAPVITI